MKRKKRIIVSVTNDLYTDQRVHKVCSFLHENNFEVLLVGRLRKNSPDMPARDYATKRMKLWFDKGALFYAHYNLRLFFFLLFRRTDALLSNDLDTLLANYLAKKFKRNCTLYYDSHELFTEVPELTSRPRVQKVWLSIEKWIFPKLKHVYTVNDSIADIYREKYNVPIEVVRNVSPLWKSKNIKSKKELGLPEDKKIIILQGAGINIDRGAEEAVEAMKFIENALFIIVGSGDVIPLLKEKVAAQQLSEKVKFFGRQPYDLLMQYTFHADIGLTLDKNTNLNYRYSLPNKVFDYIHTGTAIVASNLVEVANIVNKNKVGEIIENHDPKAIAQTINAILSDSEKLETFKNNCEKAARQEHWDEEIKVLEKIYL